MPTDYSPRNFKHLLLGLFLIIAGSLLNLLPINFFMGANFFLGGIFVMIIIRLYGTIWGTLAAFLVSLPTLLVWHNPLIVGIFTVEALFVGFFQGKKEDNLPLLDGLFWLLIGFPVFWLAYPLLFHTTWQQTAILIMVQVVNGIFNALIASVITTYQLARWKSRSSLDPTISFHRTLFHIIIACILIPSLLLFLINSNYDQRTTEQNLLQVLDSSTQQIQEQLITWKTTHLGGLKQVAHLVAIQENVEPKPILQTAVENIKGSFPDFAGVFIGDAKGYTIAFDPLEDAKGNSRLNNNLSDRTYFKTVKQQQIPYISDVFMARSPRPFPTATIAVPVIRNGEFSGFVAGGLDLDYVRTILIPYKQYQNVDVTIVDRDARVIASTLNNLTPLQKYAQQDTGLKSNTNALSHEFYTRKAVISPDIPWTVIVATSSSPYQQQQQNVYLNNLTIMLSLLLIALITVEYISRKLTQPINLLAVLTSNLPYKLMHNQPIEWPQSNITEVASLVNNFSAMATILQDNFKELMLAITSAETATSNLQSKLSFVQVLIDTIPIPIFYKNTEGLFIGCNLAFERLVDYPINEIIGRTLFDILPNDVASLHHQRDLDLLEHGGTQVYEDSNFTTKEKINKYTFIVSKTLFFNADSSVGGLVGVMQDITDRKHAEQTIWNEKERALVTLHSIGDAVITTNAEGIIEFLNPIAEQLTGWSTNEASGKPVTEILRLTNEKGGHITAAVDKCLKEGVIVNDGSNTILIHKDGHQYAIEESAAPIKDRNNQILGSILVLHDVTEKRQLLQQMYHQAHHDPLTGLPNRLLFLDRLNRGIINANRNKSTLALMFLDLDRFKMVNDTMGHAMGDQLLIGVAQRLKSCLRESDTISRMGGDEFTILLPQINRPEDVAIVAQKIVDSLRQPWTMGGFDFHITTSIGIALYPNDGDNSETLMKHADMAMYRTKEQGKNNYQLFTPDMNAQIVARLELEHRLHHAVARNEFILHYQPQYNTATGQITGMEALLRWNTPKGLILPGEFIPIAEDTGLIVPIGEWVLRTACAHNKRLQNLGHTPLKVTINLSARQFKQPNLVDTIHAILAETQLDPQWLELEITETIAMDDVDFTIKMLNELRSMGIYIAIDDFGTGYSSLNYLKKFPINTLKIDRSFVRDINNNAEDAALVSTIIVLAQNLKLKVIAEGVESEEQLAFLSKHRCFEIQGFWFSRPVPFTDLIPLLQHQTK